MVNSIKVVRFRWLVYMAAVSRPFNYTRQYKPVRRQLLFGVLGWHAALFYTGWVIITWPLGGP